jgi:integrase
VKFPQTIRHRRVEAKIYGKSEGHPFYRLAYYAAGKRQVRSFAKYGEAHAEAERVVRDLSAGSQAAALSASQSRDALAALQRLESFRQSTGRKISLLGAVSEFVEAASKLAGRGLGEAVDGFMRTVATVQRRDIAQAAREFLEAAEPLTKAANGHRAQISPKYAYNRAIQLERFAKTFPGAAVCEITKEHLDKFIRSLGEFSAKSRNHYRATVRQFLQWAVRKDYLAATHRLGEADGLRPEHANTADVGFYTPSELAALLVSADVALRPLLAIGGLAGLRSAELLRLDWADVWRVPGHVEITAGKSKTRQRRLVEICPTLQSWLEPYRSLTAGKVWPGEERTFQDHFGKLCETANIARKTNGLRHAFCTYHFALHSNEGLTANQAGNSPAMIHGHYKGLATKTEAEQWFAVRPPPPAANVIPLSDAKIA